WDDETLSDYAERGARLSTRARMHSRPRPAIVPARLLAQHRRSPRSLPWLWLMAGACLALGCALAGLRRPGHPGTGAREPTTPAPIISSSALLPDHTHLLRERSPAHRARVHDDCGRRRRPSSAPAWGGRLPP